MFCLFAVESIFFNNPFTEVRAAIEQHALIKRPHELELNFFDLFMGGACQKQNNEYNRYCIQRLLTTMLYKMAAFNFMQFKSS